MENNILRDIIDVEKEIQQSVERTKVSTHEWLQKRKKEIDADLAGREAELKHSFEEARKKQVEDADSKAAARARQAEQQAEKLSLIENEILTGIVRNHIHKILPE